MRQRQALILAALDAAGGTVCADRLPLDTLTDRADVVALVRRGYVDEHWQPFVWRKPGHARPQKAKRLASLSLTVAGRLALERVGLGLDDDDVQAMLRGPFTGAFLVVDDKGREVVHKGAKPKRGR